MTRTVLFGGVPTRMAAEEPRLAGRNLWAIARGRFLDEGTGQPIVTGLSVTTDFPRLQGRAVGAVVGLYGFPPDAFPLLDEQPYDLALWVETNAHFSQTVPIHVPKRDDGFASFDPVPLGDVVLHRRATVLTGRCRRATTGAPIAGAAVRVTKAWLTLPPPGASVPEESAVLVSIWPPLPYSLDDATAEVRRCVLAPRAPRTLDGFASAGDLRVAINDAGGLAPGDLLRIDGDVSDRLEYATAASISGNALTLARPLLLNHRTGAIVEPTTVENLGSAKAVAHGGVPGDVALYLSDASGLATGDAIRVRSPGQAESFHRVGLYSATTGTDGSFALPPLTRAGQVELTADASGLNASIKKLVLFTGAEQNGGDFLL